MNIAILQMWLEHSCIWNIFDEAPIFLCITSVTEMKLLLICFRWNINISTVLTLHSKCYCIHCILSIVSTELIFLQYCYFIVNTSIKKYIFFNIFYTLKMFSNINISVTFLYIQNVSKRHYFSNIFIHCKYFCKTAIAFL